jgi:hypothetical protein
VTWRSSGVRNQCGAGNIAGLFEVIQNLGRISNHPRICIGTPTSHENHFGLIKARWRLNARTNAAAGGGLRGSFSGST